MEKNTFTSASYQQRMYAHLVAFHPDVLIRLENEKRVTSYLSEKADTVLELHRELQQQGLPPYQVDEQVMTALTADLWPSKYQYLSELLEEVFPERSAFWRETGVRTVELMNLVEVCKPVFEQHEFSVSTEESAQLRREIVNVIQSHLEDTEEKEEQYGVQRSTEAEG